jgi:membrane protein required for colicin V production
MNWIDILILVPLLWGAFNGFKKGLISQVLGTFGLIIGIWLGTQYPGLVEGFLKDFVNEEYLKIISFVVIFLAVVIVTALLSKLLEKVINFIQLKMLNKLGGVIVGVAKILLFMLIFVFILENWPTIGKLINSEQKSQSLVYPKLVYASDLILPELQKKADIDISSDPLNTILESAN